MKKGPNVNCPNCKESFQISKSSEDGDLERCIKCDAKLEVIKKGKKIDVRLIENEKEERELDLQEWDFDE